LARLEVSNHGVQQAHVVHSPLGVRLVHFRRHQLEQ